MESIVRYLLHLTQRSELHLHFLMQFSPSTQQEKMWKKHAMYWLLHFANVFTTCKYRISYICHIGNGTRPMYSYTGELIENRKNRLWVIK